MQLIFIKNNDTSTTYYSQAVLDKQTVQKHKITGKKSFSETSN